MCIPFRNNEITPETIQSLAKFPPEWNGIKFVGEKCEGSNLIKQRNDLLWGNSDLREFDDSIDMYLFIDSDVAFSIDDFEKIYSLNKPVVFGLYPYAEGRGYDGYMVGGRYFYGFPGCTGEDLRIAQDDKRVYEGPNLWGGFGFCLIRKEVLQKIAYPWIEPRVIKTPDLYPRGAETVFDDVGFCLKLRDAGIPIVLDNRLNLQHVNRRPGISAISTEDKMKIEAYDCMKAAIDVTESAKLFV